MNYVKYNLSLIKNKIKKKIKLIKFYLINNAL